MAEYIPVDPTPNSQPEFLPKESPPSTPPSPNAIESDVKLSRKREREVSLEPVTTPKATIDVDPLLRDHKETRTPAKKNKIHLDATEEEEDVSPSRSPSHSPLSVSPPREMKIIVRQISQGVEDLSWRNMKATTPEKEMEMDSITTFDKDEEDPEVLVAADAPTEIDIHDGKVPPDRPSDPQTSESAMDVQPKDPETSVGDASNTLPVDIPSPRGSDSDGGEKDKGLKRKFVERGTSQGFQENGNVPNSPGVEPLKRPRDDSDKDDNPRETKRPSPPPESEPAVKKSSRSPPPSPPKLKSGFMSYASSSSPFASVKGQNIFSSSKPATSPPPFSASPPATSPFSPFSSGLGEPSSLGSTAAKRTGFEAFASSSSPFVAVSRSKSPVSSSSKLGRNKSPSRRANPGNVNAFSAYASGGVHSFAIPVQKRARAGSPSGSSSRSSVERNSTVSVIRSNGGVDSGAEDDGDDRPVSFGEKLRAGKDDDELRSDEEQSKFMLTEQEFMTGEEDEDTVHQVRGKLFSLSDGNQWKERGTGTLKLNVRRSDGSSARLVMRKEAVYTVLLNVTLFHGMRCVLAQDPRYLRFSVIESGGTTHYNLRVSSAKIAQELMEEINANIPPA